MYVKATPPTDLNRNTEWFTYPGVWTTYILILFFSWLLILSVFGCSPAWPGHSYISLISSYASLPLSRLACPRSIDRLISRISRSY